MDGQPLIGVALVNGLASSTGELRDQQVIPGSRIGLKPVELRPRRRRGHHGHDRAGKGENARQQKDQPAVAERVPTEGLGRGKPTRGHGHHLDPIGDIRDRKLRSEPIRTVARPGPRDALNPNCQACSYITDSLEQTRALRNVCLIDTGAIADCASTGKVRGRSANVHAVPRTGARLDHVSSGSSCPHGHLKIRNRTVERDPLLPAVY